MLNAPFCPIKQKLRKKQSEVSMVKIPQHKVTKWGNFFTDSSSRILLAIRPQISSLRGAVLWLGQNQNIMLDNFEIFQKVMAFQKMNTSKQAFSKFLSWIAQKKLKKNGFTIRLNFIPLRCGVLTVTSRDCF